MRQILRYEGEGRGRRAVWSDNVPAAPVGSRRPRGALVVGDAGPHESQLRAAARFRERSRAAREVRP